MAGAWDCGKVHWAGRGKCIALAATDHSFIHNEQPSMIADEVLARYEQSAYVPESSNPNLQLRRRKGPYNCVGMIFASRRTAIDIDSLHEILRRDRFTQLGDVMLAAVGDIVVYYTKTTNVPVHVGLIWSKCNDVITILSKCGSDVGEYFHPLDDYPLGIAREFWTDRL